MIQGVVHVYALLVQKKDEEVVKPLVIYRHQISEEHRHMIWSLNRCTHSGCFYRQALPTIQVYVIGEENGFGWGTAFQPVVRGFVIFI